MKHTLIQFIVCLPFCTLFSQNYIDLLKVNVNTGNLNRFDSSTSKTQVNEIGVDLTAPIKCNESTSIISGLIYENIQTKLFSDGGIRSFGALTIKLGLNKIINQRWSGTLVLLPKIASDFETLGNKDFQLGALSLLKFKKNDNLNYKLGLYYNSELFGPFFVPILGIYYLSPNKKMEANILLPLQADLNYKPHTLLDIGFNFTGQTRSYHLYGAKKEENAYLTRTINEFAFYLKFNLTKSLSFQTKIGKSFGRSYRVYNENDKVTFGLPALFIGKNRKQLNTDFSDGTLIQFIFLYRFNL